MHHSNIAVVYLILLFFSMPCPAKSAPKDKKARPAWSWKGGVGNRQQQCGYTTFACISSGCRFTLHREEEFIEGKFVFGEGRHTATVSFDG